MDAGGAVLRCRDLLRSRRYEAPPGAQPPMAPTRQALERSSARVGDAALDASAGGEGGVGDLDAEQRRECVDVVVGAAGLGELVRPRRGGVQQHADEVAEAGFWRIGLTGAGRRPLADAIGSSRVALVLGAEGDGMRANTEGHCDELARLPISPWVESLNVSNAAAIALAQRAADPIPSAVPAQLHSTTPRTTQQDPCPRPREQGPDTRGHAATGHRR